MGASMNNRTFGAVMIVLGGLLLWFVATGALLPAPLLLAFASAGSVAAVLLGLWAILGRY
jgi:hypothetical protein